MPIYEYECEKCNEKFEVLHFSHESEEDLECPACQGRRLKRVQSPFNSTSIETTQAGGCRPAGGG
jgi:putative FmdB family regulatory protein